MHWALHSGMPQACSSQFCYRPTIPTRQPGWKTYPLVRVGTTKPCCYGGSSILLRCYFLGSHRCHLRTWEVNTISTHCLQWENQDIVSLTSSQMSESRLKFRSLTFILLIKTTLSHTWTQKTNLNNKDEGESLRGLSRLRCLRPSLNIWVQAPEPIGKQRTDSHKLTFDHLPTPWHVHTTHIKTRNKC